MHRFEKKYLAKEAKEIVEGERKAQAQRDTNMMKALGKMGRVFGKARVKRR